MQKSVIGDKLTIDYASFDQFFRVDGGRVHHGYHCPPLQSIRDLHHHDALELGYCFEGSGVFWIDGLQIPFTAPCASLIYPGQLHKACSTGLRPSRWIFITIRPEKTLPTGARGGVITEPELLHLARLAAAECEAEAPQYERCVHHLMAVITLIYERTAPGREEESGERRYLMERLQPVLDYIAQHYMQDLQLGQLSAILFVHPSTLRSWFQRALGTSPMQYVQRTRISTACSLLQSTPLPVAEIAQMVGYPTLSSFNRQFSAACGCSPKIYRQNSAVERSAT